MTRAEKRGESTRLFRILLIFGLTLGFLSLVYLPTFLYPYLLADEAWIVRPNTHTCMYSMGRPLFSAFAWVSAQISAEHGLSVIYVMRGSAVIGLAFSAYFIMRWLERWGHDRFSSLGFALAAMTLPAYQIVVADGTQLAFAILFSILATLAFHRGFESRSTMWITGSAILLTGALLIYQQQALIVFALLAIPLLQHPGERRVHRLVISCGAFLAIVACLYFVAWRIIYSAFWPDKIDTRYGPDAIGLPTFEQLITFKKQFFSAANLWHVADGHPSWIMIIVAVLIAVKIGCDIRTRRHAALLSYAIFAGLIVASDSFALAAHAYPSYVTATAMTLLVFYWAFSGAAKLLGSYTTLAACGLALVGGVFAFITVKREVAVPNWRHFQEVRAAILAHPADETFHFIGGKLPGPSHQEFSWRNVNVDGYLSLVAINVADDLLLKKAISSKRRSKMVFSYSDSEPQPDSVIVSLD